MSASPHRRPAGRRRLALAAAGAAAVLALGAVPLALNAGASTGGTPAAAAAADLGHAVLPARDGWAAEGAGTTGGRSADAAHTFTVTTRAELAKALAAGPAGAPRIIRVKGVIDANTDDTGRALGCADYAAGTGYSDAAYAKAYDPAVRGRTKLPSGRQEDARRAAQARQAARVVLGVPSHTTIVGVPGTGAGITGGNLTVKNAQDVIVRNLALTDVRDCFPQWDPTDGPTGNWNSAYDAVSLRGATHVWIDHDTFSDAPHLDAANPTRFGREYQVHDGALDITNGSDLVTASYNRFADHDKTMLIGSSDKDTGLRVTLHHNVFQGVVQRAPLARVGQIHLYDNYYDTAPLDGYAHGYSVNSRAARRSWRRTTTGGCRPTGRSPNCSAATAPGRSRAAATWSTARRPTWSPRTTPPTPRRSGRPPPGGRPSPPGWSPPPRCRTGCRSRPQPACSPRTAPPPRPPAGS
ncbi:polysaccharide lyase family 1 protein [Kitasatospora arboriphila]